MLREGERPPIDKNYNNKNKNHQNNQIIDEEQQEQPEWADFTSQQIKVGEKNQNKWGLTMSQDRNTILGIKTKQQDSQSKTIQASESSNLEQQQQQQQQLEISMGQISTGQINSHNDPTIIKAQPEFRPKDLSAIEQQQSKLGVTTESSNSIQNVQFQQKSVDKTLKQKKMIDQKLDGVFQAPAIPQNTHPQYSNQVINRQYPNQQNIPNQLNIPNQQIISNQQTIPNHFNSINSTTYYDTYNHQNNLYYISNPSSNIQQQQQQQQQQQTSAINPSLMTPQQQQNYYTNQQAMMYNAQQQQQYQQQAYQYQQYMQYNNNNPSMQWAGMQQQQMQYQQQKAQNNPFACPLMNLQQTARVWEYVDPQGKKQGKFTGTQMNDWLHAGYFTMDLKISCDGFTYMKLGQYLGQQTYSYQAQIQQQQQPSSGGGSTYYYPIN